jgi:hypothetical protein
MVCEQGGTPSTHQPRLSFGPKGTRHELCLTLKIKIMPDSIFVGGHGVAPSQQIFITVKDKVSRTAAFASLAASKPTKSGSIFLAKGITMEEAKSQFPLGRDLSKLVGWGEPRLDAKTKDGEAINGVYEVVELTVEETTETEGE